MRRCRSQPTQAELDHLADAFFSLSTAEKSVLIAAVSALEPNRVFRTRIDSASYLLWTRMARFDWMKQLDPDDALEQTGLSDVYSEWRLTDIGRARLPVFLGYAEDRGQGAG